MEESSSTSKTQFPEASRITLSSMGSMGWPAFLASQWLILRGRLACLYRKAQALGQSCSARTEGLPCEGGESSLEYFRHVRSSDAIGGIQLYILDGQNVPEKFGAQSTHPEYHDDHL
jgi:hypothetical protein